MRLFNLKVRLISASWLAVLICVLPSVSWSAERWLHMFLPADNDLQQGFARITNVSNNSGSLTIQGVDDAGVTSSGTVTISLDAGASVQFNSQDLEDGNSSKGLSGGLGDGTGNWRLLISSDLDLDIAGLFRNTSGFVNLLHSTAPTTDGLTHRVNFFNPGSNTNQQSRLRIVNRSSSSNSISISGIDDDGQTAGPMTFSIDPMDAVEVNAAELEDGAQGFAGSLGDGSGKWRLTVTSSESAAVMSLLEDPNGYLSNLSEYVVLEDGSYVINDMPSASSVQQGFVRISNPNDSDLTVTVNGVDDAGDNAQMTVSVPANNSVQFNSDDLEQGNTSKGLTGSFGVGTGNWRLDLTTDKTIYVQALFRTDAGFVNLIHDNGTALPVTSQAIPFFNPGSNTNQVSVLRLINPQPTTNSFTISGIDDNGDAGSGNYNVNLGAGESVEITAQTLEESLGDGSGKWRLTVESTSKAYAQSLLFAPDDYLSNLSRSLKLAGSEGAIYTDSWMINNSEQSTTIEDSGGDKALVNVQSVTETVSGSNDYVQVQATGVPNYAHVLTQAEVDWLNNRQKADSDFGAGNQTTASAGEAVPFGSDINYSSNNSCVTGAGDGYWPPGPVCPLDVEHSSLFRTAPEKETGTNCETSLDTMGHWVNGVSIYNYGDGQSYNGEGVWTHLAPFFEVYDLDICGGHAANNDYHHHSYPHCLAEQLNDDGDKHSPVYGFIQDGFPVYGPWQSNGQLAKSCWIARDYNASTSEGGCGDGTRSCQLDDNMDVSAGVSSVSSGPSTSGTVTSGSGNEIDAASGAYFEDYYYDSLCSTQGEPYLDEFNGHDTGDGRGYHYHVTIVDDSEENTLGIGVIPTFPFYTGPALYGDVSQPETDWRCANTGGSGGGMGGGM